MGILSTIFGKEGSTLDPQTQAFRKQIYDQANKAAGASGGGVAGTNPYLDQAGSILGNLGMGNVDNFQNPYQQQVVDALRGEFANTRSQTMSALDDQATRQGAFQSRNNRQGVAQGQALGELGRAENSQIGGLLYQGNQDAWSRAQQTAGMSAAYGDQQRNYQQQQLDASTGLRGLNILMGPGQLQPGQMTHSGGLLGTALGVGSMFAGLGGIGGIGSLLGLGSSIPGAPQGLAQNLQSTLAQAPGSYT